MSNFKAFVSDLLRTHADIFVNGFKSYYDDVKGFLSNKLELLNREL